MSDAARSYNNQTNKPKTLFGKTVSFPFVLFGVLCGSLFLSIVVEWLGMYFFWQDQGYHHAEQMFYSELENLSENFTQSIILSDPLQTIEWLIKTVYEWLFVKTGLSDQVQTIVIPKDTDSWRKMTFRENINLAFNSVHDYSVAAAFTAMTFLVRVLVLCLSIPLFILALFVGLIDGLVRRDIRKFSAGRESGFIYHRAKSLLMPILTLPWVIYLALPISVSPLWILLPSATLLSIVMNIAVGSFKKYL
ncbi:TIGR03747 family integrating conjugative element membrane protein [Zophobihabitans entericus]|uniref:TIGR03747 family integrating conjugative element membrane protein n=1 Tax=Zophobihabitans entericus TaxID=1635327 RepID=A0A6G9IEP1_9GAMM|nr:TIGR03747 family integrating conjugative element membrane protein [Zophobihabitans entericus]QIQ22164.1 TIGR03747 family integrating conjugative element membrane protein [Zophobihabitans entericus]